MKHGKNPTVAQKRLLKSFGLVPENWLIVKHTPDYLTVAHRDSGQVRSVTLREEEEE